MIITSHSKKMYDVALASAAGQVSQLPFVVLPVAMLLLAVLAAAGVIPTAASGTVFLLACMADNASPGLRDSNHDHTEAA